MLPYSLTYIALHFVISKCKCDHLTSCDGISAPTAVLMRLTSIYQHIPRFVRPATMHIHPHGICQCSYQISLNNRSNFRSSNVQVFASTASSILFSTSGQDSRVRVHFDVGSPLLLCFSHTELKYCRTIEQSRITES